MFQAELQVMLPWKLWGQTVKQPDRAFAWHK